MSLIFKHVTRKDPVTADITADYMLRDHCSKTTLDLDMSITVGAASTTASITIETNACASPHEAFDKLVEYLERAAKALRERGIATDCIPIFSKARSP